ncbi:hypothetical protein [Sphingomonas sp. R86521]|uniref:hypothetical protein n=1 Tax=Sphingomonas sp. R86521 TaxID=3093860 RepID=UPI0036D25DF6
MDAYDEEGNFLTPRRRYCAIREALAGEQIVTPLEAFILCGGDPDDFDEGARHRVEADLQVLRYEPRTIAMGVYGKPKPMWVRDDPWNEDEAWRDDPDEEDAGTERAPLR